MRMTSIRQWHTYLGLFIAPSVLFFALSGATQLFSLHEAHGRYQPPALVEKLSSVHKDQVFAFGNHHPQAAPAADAGKPDTGTVSQADTEDDGDKVALSTLVLKGFFLVVALCLALSTAFGLWMGLTQTRRKPIAWLLVLAGALIPVGLLLF
jgi:uncharacterized iron-regulated membrane protein